MKFFEDFRFGIHTYREALSYIFKKGLAWFFLFPLILNILLFVGGWEYLGQLTTMARDYIQNWLDLENATFWGAKTIDTILSGFIWLLFKILFFLTFAYLGGYIIIIILSPIFSYLSEKTEKLRSGEEYVFDIRQILKDVVRGITIALRNLFIELILAVLMFILSFIPVIGWFSALILFLISAYFYGFSFMDYALERKKLNIRDSIQFMRKNKGMVVANGLIFSLCLILPFCGVSLSSFAAIVSVVAGTIAIEDRWET